MSTRSKRRSTSRHTAFRRLRRRSSSRPDGTPSKTKWTRHGTALPGWADLAPEQNKRVRTSSESFLQRVPTVRFALVILALAAVFTAYVGHVHATQQLLADVQQARSENHKLHLKHNRLKGAFDRKTGPSLIYERARRMGLEESVTYGPKIQME